MLLNAVNRGCSARFPQFVQREAHAVLRTAVRAPESSCWHCRYPTVPASHSTRTLTFSWHGDESYELLLKKQSLNLIELSVVALLTYITSIFIPSYANKN